MSKKSSNFAGGNLVNMKTNIRISNFSPPHVGNGGLGDVRNDIHNA